MKKAGLFFLSVFTVLFAQAAPIRFIENKGQWEQNVLFKADIGGGSLFVEANTLSYYFYDTKALHNCTHKHSGNSQINCHVVKVKLLMANPGISVSRELQAVEYYNYYLGQDPSRWVSGARAFQKITLHNVYPGIDFELETRDEQLKYNFVVKPGANPTLIRLAYEGQSQLMLNKLGDLSIGTSLGTILEKKPFVYQAQQAEQKKVQAQYLLQNNILSFQLGKYNPRQDLVIDPEIIFATFSGSDADNFGYTATYDKYGNTYSAGNAFSVGFPTTSGAFQRNFQGGYTNMTQGDLATDVAILKYNPEGTQLLYATYLGGKLHNEQPHSIVVNNQEELVVMGSTRSADFPVSINAYDKTHNGSADIFVTRFNEQGTILKASTFYGGTGLDGLNGSYDDYNPGNSPLSYNYGDNYRGEVLVDKNNNIHIASCTRSRDGLSFPADAFSKSLSGSQDMLYLRFNADLSQLQKGTLLGGDGFDAAYALAFDKTEQSVYICGGTTSSNINCSNTALQKKAGGDVDGLVIAVDQNSFSIKAQTYLGTSSYDQVYFIQCDANNRVYVTGQSNSGNFPIAGNVYRHNGGNQFISILSSDLSALIRSTTLGKGQGVPDISPSAFMVDFCGNVCLSGWGGKTNQDHNAGTGNTIGLVTTSNAFQKTTDGSDFYLVILSGELDRLRYASFFGGAQSEEHVDGGTSRFDTRGIIYQSVCGGCGGFSDFPTTAGAWSRVNKGKRVFDPSIGGCNNATFKINLNPSLFPPSFKDTVLVINATDSLVYPFSVSDDDEEDSIFYTVSGKILSKDSIPGNTARVIGVKAGLRSLTGVIAWGTQCVHATGDTFELIFRIRDNACPSPLEKTGRIKIFVKPAPLMEPPYLSCIRSLDSDVVVLRWEADASNNNKYFKELKMNKLFPDNSEKELGTYPNKNDSLFDFKALNHKVLDYCYYMYAVNVCGKHSDTTRYSCTRLEPDTATVNPFIMAMDTVLYVYATDSLNYQFEIKSKEEKVKVSFDYHGDLFADSQVSVLPGLMFKQKGKEKASGYLSWLSTCKDLSRDTFYVDLLVWDDACPVPHSVRNKIKIVVQPPPPCQPPVLSCIKKLDDATVKVRWKADSTQKYFSHYILYKYQPGSSFPEVLAYYPSGADEFYVDPRTPRNQDRNYCYVMQAVNVCQIKGDSSLRSCSIVDSSFIPDPVYISLVTVENNKELAVHWAPSTDKTLEQYNLYRAENLPGIKRYKPYGSRDSLTTSFIDQNVDVQNVSYCYKITQKNDCGKESPSPYEACSIVLKGASFTFEHHLEWMEYNYWFNGVKRYELQRYDPLLPLQEIYSAPPTQKTYIDKDLYDEMGLYYYRVLAHEDAKGPHLVSSSNTVRLVQKPIVYVPTAFSPNGDGLNDKWGVSDVFVKEFNVKIFNRWGQMIYESNDKNFRFDGTFWNNLPHDNVFAYLITYTGWDNSIHNTSGDFTMIH